MSTVITDPITDARVDDWQSVALVAAISLYGTLTIAGVITVTTFVAVLIKGRSTFKEIPFFTIVWQLTLCNMFGIYIQATCKFPLLFVDTSDNDFSGIWELIGTRIIYFTDTGVTFFILLMALNRFAVFVAPKMLLLFSKQKVLYPILVTWLMVCFNTSIKIFYGPIEKFDRKNWSISQLLIREGDTIIYTIVSWTDYIVAILLLLIYTSIYIMIRSQKSAHGIDSSDDTSLLKQAVIVALFLSTFRMFANVSGAIKSVAWVTWLLNIFRFMASVCNNMLNPVLFLNTKSVRAILKEMLHCGTPGSREETNGSGNSIATSKSCLPFFTRSRRSINDIATAGSLPVLLPPVSKQDEIGNTAVSPVE